MQLEMSKSARRDARVYIFLMIGILLALIGATVDPSTNCSEDGIECAPWLIYVALVLGLILGGGSIHALIADHKWGYRLNINERRLDWWHTMESPGVRSIQMDEVFQIKVVVNSESSDDIYLFDKNGQSIHFTVMNLKDRVGFGQGIGAIFPHISVVVE